MSLGIIYYNIKQKADVRSYKNEEKILYMKIFITPQYKV